eukprot:CAMPEP_0206134726 /NCGR_PEP_ID=MMETSP1473-20131121/175_1 /ASSEMBLY_ACC=CAM_ASM_001109 /TAXON_ID=1461547 /ORGANISM="Stichococcus sp, Strain RCC1054" /LENGTH=376 /DNA_ID=CAMNT_0053526347 /DNA_START=105 /DNA_END=1231 /DNA_ORIENTATION=+
MATAGDGAPKGKVKGKKLHIAEFQAGLGAAPAKQGSMSWADELDVTESGGAPADLPPLPDVPEVGSYGRSPPNFGGRASSGPGASYPPTQRTTGGFGGGGYGGGGSGGGGRDFGGPPIPSGPPYKAYITSLPHAAQEQDVAEFFSQLQVQDILLLRHSDTGNPRGAFAEFAGPEDLEAALQMDGEAMLGRSVRIAVAEAKPDRGGRRGGFGGGFADRDFGPRDGGYGGDRREGGGFGGGYGRFDEPGGGGQWRTGAPVAVAPPTGQPSAAGEGTAPGERPSLTLQPTVPSAPKSNPFGNAKPVDVSARLKELDERDAKRKAEAAKVDAAARQAAAAAGAPAGGARAPGGAPAPGGDPSPGGAPPGADPGDPKSPTA